MSDTCTYNCSAHPTEISAYADISGIGVTVAFFATAWMVVLLLIGYYLVAYNPKLDPFRQPGKKTSCQYPNAADYLFLYAVRKLPGLRNLQYSEWLRSNQLELALNKCIIMYADIQIFTGLAVMISGYIALSCGLQSYHWQLTVYLVWLSSLTHLAALSFLRNHLSNNPGPRIWRVTLMFIVLVFLAMAVGLAGYFNWDGKDASGAPDFAICYFGKKMDAESVAFESMIKTLILLAYGFSIRLAKMSKAFEGSLRKVPAQLNAIAMRRQHDHGEAARPRDIRTFVSFYVTGQISVVCSLLLGIYIALFTSFLGEVYWLAVSAMWVTKRYSKVRHLGPKEENEWTFGQVLPVLLVVAPLAAILEHFLPFGASANRWRQRPSRIALEILDQLERDETQDDVRVELDHSHTHSITYCGAFFLAVVACIEVGIYFVSDQEPGILEPLSKLAFSFFIFNPLLQSLWISCTLWIPHMNGNSLTKTAVHGMVLTALTAISVNEFLGSWIIETEGGHLASFTSTYFLNAAVGSCVFPVLASRNCIAFRGPRPPWIKLFSILLFLCLAALAAVLPIIVGGGSPKEFLWTLGVCICLEVAWYFFEFLMGRMDVALKWAAVLRCMSLLCILSALGVLRYRLQVAPTSWVLLPAVTVSGIIWILVGIIASVVGRRQTTTDGDNALSSS